MAAPSFQAMVGRLILFILLVMVLVAVMQISYLQPTADQHGAGGQGRRWLGTSKENDMTLHISPPAMKISVWEDEEAKLLRLGYVKPQILSWSPRIILLNKFLSDEECDRIMEIGRPKLRTSTVVDAATGKGVRSTVRTSTGMFLTERDRHDPVISYNVKRGGQRVATVLMYLTGDVEGGETYFPEANDGNSTCMCGGELKRGVSVRPDRGNAVLFWSMTLEGQTDTKSLHSSCPVISGEKWSCTKWLRTGAFQ
ncbi:hypothetical protein CBR_g12246 [Chara braunii]|uniref:Fe2OG dioxygenase domain-containing protein n=1 Tax=Chara braunii TaxID=69332 RepID=A0A388KRK7_CHABU|nr:hypothetical protein CBR_g12246 [Chara braunii]|eukprot:GBG72677.1 hypothetical protein CBR_g12246 [Chara braunii]